MEVKRVLAAVKILRKSKLYQRMIGDMSASDLSDYAAFLPEPLSKIAGKIPSGKLEGLTVDDLLADEAFLESILELYGAVNAST